MSSRRRTILAAVAGVLVLLGVGFATFLLGPGGPPAGDEPALAQASLADPGEIGFLPERILTVEIEGNLETAFEGDGGVYVVDHPEWHVGSRVRWFAEDGVLTGEHLAPGGSTLFGPDGAGFHYVTAKQGGPSETAVVVRQDGSLEATYAIPFGLNSGALIRADDTLYARAQSSAVDMQTLESVFTDLLVPVAQGNRALTDSESEAGTLEAYFIGEDGMAYQRLRVSEPEGATQVVQQYIERVEDGRRLEIPSSATPVGVDSSGRLMLVLDPRRLTGIHRPLPGWATSVEPFAKVYVVDMAGDTMAAAILSADSEPYPARTLALRADGFTFAALSGRTLTVWSYGGLR